MSYYALMQELEEEAKHVSLEDLLPPRKIEIGEDFDEMMDRVNVDPWTGSILEEDK